jgi:MFS family permease
MLGAAGYVAYFTIIYFVTNVVVVTVLWILPIYPLVQSAAAALMSDYTSAADRGKGLGLLESAISLGGGLGPLAGGLIADAAQLQAVIVFSLAIALISVASSQILLKEKPTVAIPDPILSGM